MKKTVLILGLAVLGTTAMTSCKKDYVCDAPGIGEVKYPNLTKDQAETAEAACELGGGTWSVE